jgi:hypothetical protein
MFSCVFCEEEYTLTTYLCEKCRRLKHLKKIYRDRFNEVLEHVLVRNEEGMYKKERQEITKEKEQIENNLQNKNKNKNFN